MAFLPQVLALAKELTAAEVFDGNDDDDVELSVALAEELAKLGAKKVEHLADLDEAEIRAAAAAAQLPAVQLKRLVKLRAQVQSRTLPCAPYVFGRIQQPRARFEQVSVGSTSAGGGSSVLVSAPNLNHVIFLTLLQILFSVAALSRLPSP